MSPASAWTARACAMFVVLLIAGFVSASTSEAQSGAPAQCDVAVSTGADADAVRALEERGARVNVEGWTIDEARAFFAPTWVAVGPDGVVRGVEEVFASFVDGRSRPWATSFDLLELDVRVYCDMAVVIGLAEARGSQPGQAVRFRYLNVWRKIAGQWRYSEQQYVRLTP